MNPQLQTVVAMNETKVSLRYDDGVGAVLDLASLLQGPVFEALKDSQFFAKVAIDDETIRWPNGADIDPYVLRLWVEKGRVLSREETDAWFAAQNAAA